MLRKKNKEPKEKTLEELELEKTKKIEIIQAKEQKKGEFSAFLTLLIITVILIGGVYIWYTKFYDSERDTWLKNIIDSATKQKYEVVSLNTEHDLITLDDYIIEKDKTNIYKIFNTKGDILFEGEEEYTNIYLGEDNKLYIIYNEEDPINNLLTIYTIEEKAFKELNTYGEEYHKFSPLIKNNTLLAIVEEYTEEQEDTEIKITNINYLDNTKTTIEKGTIQPIKQSNINKFIDNTKYLIIKSSDTFKYGIYSLEDKKQIVDYKYDQLKYIKEDLFIARQDKKEGIINTKLKKIVDFIYDDIIYKETFYLASLDNETLLLDKDYKEVTRLNTQNIKVGNDPIYDIETYTFDDIIIIPMNNKLIYLKGQEMTELEDNYIYQNNNLVYTYNLENKTYNIYDKHFNTISKIDLKDYDIDINNELNLINDTVIVGTKNPLYFDYKTGELLENIKDYEYEIGNIKYEYNGKKNTINIYEDDELKQQIEYNPKYNLININEDDTFYYLDNNNYITIKANK